MTSQIGIGYANKLFFYLNRFYSKKFSEPTTPFFENILPNILFFKQNFPELNRKLKKNIST